MYPSSETKNYDALLSLTLANYRATLQDTISTSNAFFFELKGREDGWKGVSNLGERIEVPLMYEMGTADFYSGYDTLDTTPMDGITKAFFDWTQMNVPITISRIEERKNSGELALVSLLKTKTKQALLGIQDLFGKALIQGNGPNSATAIVTPYTSAINGATGFDPLPKLIHYSPSGSLVVGNINQTTYAWWRNQIKNSSGTTFAGVLKEMSTLYNLCGAGPGGSPNLFLCDRKVYELYEAAMWAKHQNPSYTKAGYPFDSLQFHGKPLVWDEFVPDAANSTITAIPVDASGTLYMLNTQFIDVTYDNETNFISTPFQVPENQDAKTAHIMWYGATTVSNRKKQGVMFSIDTTLTS
jgi:hypothetical protein